ncbi:MAG: aminoglycoside phosphotransferase family protein [Acidimicrobiia bacterium]
MFVLDATTCHNAALEGGVDLDPQSLARRLAAGGTIQELTATTSQVNANQVYRIWQDSESVILKVYGSDARQRRERHAMNALQDWGHTPKIRDSGSTQGLHWIVFADAGRWNLETLPENPGLARTAGQILRELHETDKSLLSNLERGIDQEWVAIDFQSTLRRLDRYRARVGISHDFIEAAQSVNPPFANEPVVAHTDAVPRNFVVDDEGAVTLINWEWATLAPPEWDLTRAAWSIGMHAGPIAAAALFDGYGKSIDGVLIDRWIVYHAAQTLVQHTEQRMSNRPSDVPTGLVHEFNRAVLGATS